MSRHRTGEFLYLGRHGGDAAQLNAACEDIFAKPWVLRVLQVADAAPHSVLVFHISGFYLLVDMCSHTVKAT